jgi:DNA-directed RNA polymerase subunit RPC12/RpoP
LAYKALNGSSHCLTNQGKGEKNLAKMKCANCHQEILEDTPLECPYCYSKSLIPIEDKYPDGFDPMEPESTRVRRSPLSGKSNHTQTILAAFGFIMLFSGIILIWYGSTLPGNITIGPEYSYPRSASSVSILGFIGLLLVAFSLSCWLYWVFQLIRAKWLTSHASSYRQSKHA